MLKVKDDGFVLGVGQFRCPANIEAVDTRSYTGKIGDMIRVQPDAASEVARVLVAIRTDKNEPVERGLARRNARSGVWEYAATAAFPKDQGARITITAIAPPGHNTTIVDVETSSDTLWLTWRCGGEVQAAYYAPRPAVKAAPITAQARSKRPPVQGQSFDVSIIQGIATVIH